MGRMLFGLFVAAAAMANADEKDEAVEIARNRLAEQLSVPADRFQLEGVEAVDWPNSAIGCPEKGMMYAQVIVPGYRVRFRQDERRHEVHVGGGRAVVCGAGEAVKGAYVLAGLRMYNQARQDLAARLKVEEKEVTGTWKAVRWPDASLGCPEPDKTYEPVPTPGYLIKLSQGGRTYLYHADASRVVPCDPPGR